MDLRIANKTAVITGASAGIGLSCARLFAQEGCNVTLVARTESRLREAAATIKAESAVNVQTLALDLGKPSDLAQLSPYAEKADIVVNNAGAIPGGGLDAMDDAKWRELGIEALRLHRSVPTRAACHDGP